MNADGSDVKKVSKMEFVGHARPVWCPDSACLIYEIDVGKNVTKLYLLNLTMMEETPLLSEKDLTSSQTTEWYASRSPKRGYILIWMFSNDSNLLYAYDVNKKSLYSLGLYGSEADLYP
jgi:hypothetical protein